MGNGSLVPQSGLGMGPISILPSTGKGATSPNTNTHPTANPSANGSITASTTLFIGAGTGGLDPRRGNVWVSLLVVALGSGIF